jgi:hypothetical protein
LRLAAIEAAGSTRPLEATERFAELLNSGDEDIVEAIYDVTAMAGATLDEDDGEDL